MTTEVKDVERLIDEYWDLAFMEGASGRTTDTPNGDAQRVRSAISSLLVSLPSQVAEALSEQNVRAAFYEFIAHHELPFIPELDPMAAMRAAISVATAQQSKHNSEARAEHMDTDAAGSPGCSVMGRRGGTRRPSAPERSPIDLLIDAVEAAGCSVAHAPGGFVVHCAELESRATAAEGRVALLEEALGNIIGLLDSSIATHRFNAQHMIAEDTLVDAWGMLNMAREQFDTDANQLITIREAARARLAKGGQ